MLNTALDARVSPETLRKIESGRVATPAFPTIAAIADVLGLSLDAVWSEISQSDGGAELEIQVATQASGWPRKSRPRSSVAVADDREHLGAVLNQRPRPVHLDE